MVDAAAKSASSEVSWWYQQADETKGPVSEAELRALQLNASALVWHEKLGDEWLPIGEALPRPPGPALADVSPKWQSRFAKFEGAEPPYYSFNVWGLLFSVLYYFYLRMWKKGLLILGISLWGTLGWAAFELLLNIDKTPFVITVLPNIFCAWCVNGDFYKLKRDGETIWMPFKRFDRPWTIAVFVLIPFFASVVLGALAEANATQSDGDDKRAFVIDPPKLRKWSAGKAAASSSTAVWTLEQRNTAEANCRQWLQDRLGGSYTDRYEQNLARTYKVDLSAGNSLQNKIYFGGHRALYVFAYLVLYENARIANRTLLPEHWCVLNDNLDVIGAETDLQVTGFK